MSESENMDNVDQETKHENNPKKRIRHRKKHLYESIMKQMEFYFSDANLSKDRYLGDLVKNDPFVPLVEFLKFNKIRSLTQDVGDIVKAMKHSTFLELSEDKIKVRRKTQMMPYDADLRTIYVESIPVTASREWLERVFSDYGKVAYISLPKFKNSQNIKGFAFIEFSSPQDAQKCMNAFTKMGCKLPSCTPPEELSSIKMFSVDEYSDNSTVKDEYEPPKKKSKKSKDKKSLKNLDLKTDQESDTEKPIDTPTEENKTIATPNEESKMTDVESRDEMTSNDESKNLNDTPRKRKQKKKSLKEKGKALANGEAPKDALWGLQVLPKSEWKALRNKYLNLQRKYMKEIKMNLQNKRHAYSGIPAPAAPSVEVESVNSTQAIDNAKNVEPLQKIPGVFVKEILPEPCLDVRLTKRTIKSNIHVCGRILRAVEQRARAARRGGAGAVARGGGGAGRAGARRARGRTRLLARAAELAPPALAPASPQPTHTHIRFEDE
ncbi:unnamed protein product [Euphydryas editha]|uniref:La-related protein 7 n=1 Tax=Euphydryas editha TaxID=104508 RepID=A0AAU9VD15_EUPED|nr:unnamed protein product [Euphydryas editha]